jgi:hypothetical protein
VATGFGGLETGLRAGALAAGAFAAFLGAGTRTVAGARAAFFGAARTAVFGLAAGVFRPAARFAGAALVAALRTAFRAGAFAFAGLRTGFLAAPVFLVAIFLEGLAAFFLAAGFAFFRAAISTSQQSRSARCPAPISAHARRTALALSPDRSRTAYHGPHPCQ